jgi:hypothetical protein
MGDLVTFSPVQILDANGDPVPGAKAFFYQSGTTTPITVYSDNEEEVPHPTPVVANAAGVFPEVFRTGVTIKAVITTADDVVLYTLDPVTTASIGGSAASQISFAATTNIPENTVQKAIERVQVNMEGPLRVVSGTLSSPPYSFKDYPNSGIFPTALGGVAASVLGQVGFNLAPDEFYLNMKMTGPGRQILGGLVGAVGGTADAITLTQTGVGLLIAGQHVRFAATSSNTGATTIDLDGSGAKSCTTPKGVALPSGYIRTDAYTDAIYNGSSFVVFRQAEDGSNANGDFWRMDSGLQICKQRFSNVTIAASTDNLITWTLPAAFKGTGYAISHTLLTAFPSTCPHPLTAWATSATLASIYVNRGASTSAFFDVTAVGTWY